MNSGWLLEYTVSGRLYYFTCTNGTPTWTHDVNQAVCFARKQDAELVAAELFSTLRTVVNEHRWD